MLNYYLIVDLSILLLNSFTIFYYISSLQKKKKISVLIFYYITQFISLYTLRMIIF